MTLFTGSMVATPLITDRLAAKMASPWHKMGQDVSWEWRAIAMAVTKAMFAKRHYHIMHFDFYL